ncbi:hypothetical protein [Bradyrhizobium uaiense]|uniref:Uncharacterized protein n=1 Tax=Bradyrhizobium uaiense TaxID=2594946 RepID=A0A6P1BS88_9BRAD|nr:hypothetical protein [Bradyrhizobium uaiense]NEV01064.1 hypothetical protein [Bradyrhizobium uaiense]
MTEEEFADRLAAEQEQKTPGWDFPARIATCRDALMREVLSVSEAQAIYGDSVLRAALKEIKEKLAETEFDRAAAIVAIAREVSPKRDFKEFNYPYFEGGKSHGGMLAAAGLVLALISGTVLGFWAESTDAVARLLPERSAAAVARLLPEKPVEVNSDSSRFTSGSPPLKFSVPDTKLTEEKLQSEVESAQANSKSAQRLQAEINKLRQDLENKIITLEAQRRLLAKIQSQTSDASDVIAPLGRSLSVPTRFDTTAR